MNPLSNDGFEGKNAGFPADGIKSQSMRSVRFWTSLLTKELPETSGAIELCYNILAIGIASLFGALLDIRMSRQLKTKTKPKNQTYPFKN